MAAPPIPPFLPSFSPVETAVGAMLLHHSTTQLLYNNGAVLGISGLLRQGITLAPLASSSSSSSSSSSPSSAPSSSAPSAPSARRPPSPSESSPLIRRTAHSAPDHREQHPLPHPHDRQLPPSSSSRSPPTAAAPSLGRRALSLVFSAPMATLIGIALSAPAVALVAPQALPAFPDMVPPTVPPVTAVADAAGGLFKTVAPFVWIAFVGGLTAWGTKLSNGCTSGHMLIGLARLAPRSATAVAAFFPTAVLTHLLTRPFRPDRVDHAVRAVPAYVPVYPTRSALLHILALAAIGFLVTTLVPPVVFSLVCSCWGSATSRRLRTNTWFGPSKSCYSRTGDASLASFPNRARSHPSGRTGCTDEGDGNAGASKAVGAKAAALTTSFVTGLEFGIGLILSGMASPAKVQSFFSIVPTDLSAWDPSLLLVILFGLVPNMVVNMRRGLIARRQKTFAEKVLSSRPTAVGPGSSSLPRHSHLQAQAQSQPQSQPSEPTFLKPKYADRFTLPAQSGPFRLCIYPTSDSPPQSKITPRFILGAAAFGVAWGLEGVCPGPGIIRSVIQFSTWGTPWLLGFLIGSKMG